MNNETKQNLIYESFDALKDVWDEKYEAIRKLIAKMFVMNPHAACEMWLYLLKKYRKRLTDLDQYSEADALVYHMINAMVDGDVDKERKLAEVVFTNKELYSIIYGKCCSLGYSPSHLISHILISDDSSKLLEILSLLRKNRTVESIGLILTHAIEYCDAGSVEPCQIEVLENFIAKIPDKMDRAEAFAALLSVE